MKDTLNDRDREIWVENDEGLYRWWQSSRKGKTVFIRENRDDIDRIIRSRLDPKGGKR